MTLTESQAASGLLTAALQSQDKETPSDSRGQAQLSSTQSSRYTSAVLRWTDACF